jgi:prevent-host-death family protein
MTSISFYEARTHFSEILDQVAKGEKILITRRGKPAALLVPPLLKKQPDVGQTISAMKALRFGNKLGPGLSVRDLIEEGRRY